MCPPIFGRRRETPALPEKVATAPRPEKTAERVLIGQQRSSQKKRGLSTRRGKTLGTASLQIPLLNEGQTGMGNLNY